MPVPKVLNVQYQGKRFSFNGWVGNHSSSTSTVFEFADEEDVKHIWVDINGNFVCEESRP